MRNHKTNTAEEHQQPCIVPLPSQRKKSLKKVLRKIKGENTKSFVQRDEKAVLKYPVGAAADHSLSCRKVLLSSVYSKKRKRSVPAK